MFSRIPRLDSLRNRRRACIILIVGCELLRDHMAYALLILNLLQYSSQRLDADDARIDYLSTPCTTNSYQSVIKQGVLLLSFFLFYGKRTRVSVGPFVWSRYRCL